MKILWIIDGNLKILFFFQVSCNNDMRRLKWITKIKGRMNAWDGSEKTQVKEIKREIKDIDMLFITFTINNYFYDYLKVKKMLIC